MFRNAKRFRKVRFIANSDSSRSSQQNPLTPMAGFSLERETLATPKGPVLPLKAQLCYQRADIHCPSFAHQIPEMLQCDTFTPCFASAISMPR
jgi:hypothetical protein